MNTHERGFCKGHVNPLGIPGRLQRGLCLVPEPRGTASARGTEFHLVGLDEGGESQSGKDERGLHQRPIFGVVQTPHKVGDIDKGKPVASGRKSRKRMRKEWMAFSHTRRTGWTSRKQCPRG